jgi:hypothetical protein
MKNEKVFLEKVEESAVNKVRIVEEYQPEYGKLKKLFKGAFGVQGKVFKMVSDLLYYKGGYPKEKTEAKLKTMLDNFGNAYNFYELRGSEDIINSYLKVTYGIEIKVVKSSDLDRPGIKRLKKFEELWKATFNEDYKGESKKEILDKLLQSSFSLEASICQDKDQISITNAEFVEQECEVKKSHFMAAVGLKTEGIRKGDESVEEKINEIQSNQEGLNAAIEVLAPAE